MTQPEIVLAALAPGLGYRYTPVQLQKLMFLIDEQIPRRVGGPHFSFKPHHYGPFDKQVYRVLESLADRGLIAIHDDGSLRSYDLSCLATKDSAGSC